MHARLLHRRLAACQAGTQQQGQGSGAQRLRQRPAQAPDGARQGA